MSPPDLLSKNPDRNETIKAFKFKVLTALKKEDWPGGTRILQEWTRLAPNDAFGWYYLAFFVLKQGKEKHALHFAAKAVSLAPQNKAAAKLLTSLKRSLKAGPDKSKAGNAERWRPGQLIEGRYEIRGSKRGGMGEVLFAFDRELDHMVAIKAPLPALLETEAQKVRFYREAEAWIGLGMHPNICSAFYVRESSGVPWLYIEYVDGGTLDDWLKSQERSLTEKLDVAIQISSGMTHTHTLKWQADDGRHHVGLAHRDLKPANILMDSDGLVKITDFGLVGLGTGDGPQSPLEAGRLARKIKEPVFEEEDPDSASGEAEVYWRTITVEGKTIGTPPYMAPEQWRSAHAAGFSSDIYAFGCLLFDIFCGRRPFLLEERYRNAMPAHRLYLWEKMHLEKPPPDPRRLVPELNKELASWMLVCLEKDPQDRPQTFSEIREGLKSIYEALVGETYPRPEPRASRLMADSLNNQGVSFATIGQIRRAETAWRAALRTDPHHVEATFNRSVYEWQYKSIGYEEVHRRMEELARTHAGALRHKQLLGRMYIYFGEFAKAAEILQEAYRTEPDNLKIAKSLGLALTAQLGAVEDPSGWQRVETCLGQVAGTPYEDIAVSAGYALALTRLSKFDEAARFYKEAAEHHEEASLPLVEAVQRHLPGQEILSTIIHTGWINHMSFSDSDDQLFSGDDNKVSVYSAQGLTSAMETGSQGNRRLQREVFLQGDISTATAVSPDSHLTLAGDANGNLTFWDLQTGKLVCGLKGHSGAVRAVLFLKKGKLALSAGDDGRIRLWDVARGQSLTILEGHDGPVYALAAKPRGKRYFLSAGDDGSVRLWDLLKPGLILTLDGHFGPVMALALSPDGKFGVSGGEDKSIRLWDLNRGKPRAVFEGHSGIISGLAFTPDSRRILSTSHDKSLRFWDIQTERFEKVMRFSGKIESLAISHDGKVLALAYLNTKPADTRTICFMVMPQGDKYHLPYVVTPPTTTSLAENREREFIRKKTEAEKGMAGEDFSQALKYLASARAVPGYERDPEAVDLWTRLTLRFPHKRLRTAWEIDTFEGRTRPDLATALDPKGQYVFSGGQDRTIFAWEADTGNIVRQFEGHQGPVTVLLTDHRGHYLISGSEDHTLRIWEIERGICVRSLMDHTGAITALALDPGGRLILGADRNKALFLWDLFGGTMLRAHEGHEDYVTGLAFSHDGRFFASAGHDGVLRIWDVASGDCIKAMSASKILMTAVPLTAASLSPDGRHILGADEDGSIFRWDMNKDELPDTYKGHEGPVNALAVSPDSKYALSAGSDGTMRIWDLRTGKCVRIFEGHTGGVNDLDLSPDGISAVSTSQDRTTRLWHLDWEPEIKAISPYHEGARPYLRNFLVLHTPFSKGFLERSGRPKWSPKDLEELMTDLAHRGYGWLTPQGVDKELRSIIMEGRRIKDFIRSPAKKVMEAVDFLGNTVNRLPGLFGLPIKIAFRLAPAAVVATILARMDLFSTQPWLAAGIVLFFLLVMMVKW